MKYKFTREPSKLWPLILCFPRTTSQEIKGAASPGCSRILSGNLGATLQGPSNTGRFSAAQFLSIKQKEEAACGKFSPAEACKGAQ